MAALHHVIEVACILVLSALQPTGAKHYAASIGQSVTLECRTDLDFPVDWTFHGSDGMTHEIIHEGEVINGYRVRGFTVDRRKPGEYNLVIPSVQPTDFGTYDCVEESGIGSVHHSYLMTIDDHVSLHSTYSTNPGRSIMLPCYTTLDSAVDWQLQKPFEKKPIDIAHEGKLVDDWPAKVAIEPIRQGDYSLIIRNPQLSDAGTYSCVEDAGFGDKHLFHLKVVADSPGITVRTTAGSDVAFSCQMQNVSTLRWTYTSPNGDQTLLFNGHRVRKGSDRVNVYWNIIQGRSVIYVNHTDTSDSGMYTCSPMGTSLNRQEFSLHVSGNEAEQRDVSFKEPLGTTARTDENATMQTIAFIIIAVSVGAVLLIVPGVLFVWYLYRRTAHSRKSSRPSSDEKHQHQKLPNLKEEQPTGEADIEKQQLLDIPTIQIDVLKTSSRPPGANIERRQYPDSDAESDVYNNQMTVTTMADSCKPRDTFIRSDARPPSLLCDQPSRELTVDHLRSVTPLLDKLYFVHETHDIVKVFGLNTEHPEIAKKIDGMKEPRDIVPCVESGVLFIADCSLTDKSGCVWRMSADCLQVDKFLSSNEGSEAFRPNALSVTSHRLLVTTLDDELVLFDVDTAKHIISLRLPGKNLQHAVETACGSFVVCHLKPTPRISEVSESGYPIRVFNDDRLEAPQYLSIDSGGNIFVADIARNQIMLLNDDLQLETVLLDTDRHKLIQLPYRVFYVEGSNRLVVGSRWSGKVQVFDVGPAMNFNKL